MANYKPRKKPNKSEALKRLREAIDGNSGLDARRVGEIIQAFDKIIPPAEFAKILANDIKSDKVPQKTKDLAKAYILNLKKFHEKNEPKIENEDIEALELEEAQALLMEEFMDLDDAEAPQGRPDKAGKVHPSVRDDGCVGTVQALPDDPAKAEVVQTADAEDCAGVAESTEALPADSTCAPVPPDGCAGTAGAGE